MKSQSGCYFYLCLLIICFNVNSLNNTTPLTLLISFDGFRWDYLERTATPNFDKLISNGTKAKWMQTAFVTLTFPDHYTIATGLYEESHGIVANQFYDPQLHAKFSYRLKSVAESKWWGGEPIWVTSELQGIHAGVFFWVGSEAEIKKMRPTQWKKYSTTTPWEERVDAVVDWLANNPYGVEGNKNNISLSLLYFPQPDKVGHKFGPNSPEVTRMIGQCDNIVGYLIEKLEENDIFHDVNIIITSDHGMASVERTIPVLPQIDLNHVDRLLIHGTWAHIWAKPEHVNTVYEHLKNFHEHAQVWKKEDIPHFFHYEYNNRIPPIIIMPEIGWWLVNNTNDAVPLKGGHGFNSSHPDMRAIFVAHGPAFRQGYVSDPIDSVNIYELVCHIMKLKPAPNNGSLKDVEHLLRSTALAENVLLRSTTIAKAAIGVLVGVCLVTVVCIIFSRAGNCHPRISLIFCMLNPFRKKAYVSRRDGDVESDFLTTRFSSF